MSRTSRTTDPSGAPYRWEDYAAPGLGRVVENELDECLQGGCKTQFEYDLFRGEIEARLERAAAGKLGIHDAPAPDPVSTQPALWEVKWSFDDERQLRLYHAEPLQVVDLLFAVKYHWKQFNGMTAPQVEAAQNDAMRQGGDRFRASPLHGAADEGPF